MLLTGVRGERPGGLIGSFSTLISVRLTINRGKIKKELRNQAKKIIFVTYFFFSWKVKQGDIMSAFKDFYDILKDLVQLAKVAKNQEVLTASMNLQAKFFELREENENLNQELKQLKEKIDQLEKSTLLEDQIEYSTRGFFVIKSEEPKIPYCSMCWKRDHKQIPLSQRNGWFEYTCGNCKTNVVVMDEKGHLLNPLRK